MGVIDVAPLILKNVSMVIGTDNYEKALEQVVFTPAADQMDWTGLGGNTVTDVALATWTAGLGYMQDWDTPSSLSRYLLANEGTTKQATFQPRSGTGPSFTTGLVITPGVIGGQAKAWATTSVTLGCTGKPALVEAGAVPTLTAATPGGLGAGKIVVISGVRFLGATAVTFGGTAATAFQVLSDSTIAATLPAGAAGSAAIIVTNGTGASTSLAYTRVV